MQYASVLLFNAVVLTLDGNDAVASALALDGDRILAVGDRDGLAPLIGPDTECRGHGGRCRAPRLLRRPRAYSDDRRKDAGA